MPVTLVQICNGIARTLGASSAVARIQSAGVRQRETNCAGSMCLGPLTEAINDPGTLQVYWRDVVVDPESDTGKTTFRKSGGTIQYDFQIIADLYVSQRSHIGENIYNQTCACDAMMDVFDEQDCGSPFGVTNIRSFEYTIELAEIPYGKILYVAIRATIQVRVF